MESRLVRILQQSVTEFHQKTLSEIKDGDRTIPRPTENRKIPVGAISLPRILNQIFPQNILDLKEIFLSHFNEIRSLIPLSSSPRAFRTAWDLRSEILNPYDADVIVNQGGQFIPLNTKSRVFRCEQQGVLYGPNKRFVLGIRHVEGNYEDQLDDLGRFTYQPPENVAGMLRYRFCEYLANKMPIPYILIAIMWFEHRINKDLTHVFVIAPCKVIEYEANLKDLNESLHKPLVLQLINRSDAYSILNLLSSLNETDISIETRYELSDKLSREWSYDKINNTQKGRKVKRWAQQTGKRCPSEKCGHKEFRDLNLSKIAFGHIISQNWSKAFTFLLDKIDHPDNLYLTCQSCNSSLGDGFPDKKLRGVIETIGDWLRRSEHDIRQA